MPSPSELARIAEAYDEEDWFDFLDELDAVYRRRRERETDPEPPIPGDPQSIAKWVARRHLLIDPSIREILFLPTGSTENEIRLLEVNDRLASPDPGSRPIDAMEFGIDAAGNPISLLIADVTSEEFESIQQGRLNLPPGWVLDEAYVISRRPKG